MSRDRSDSSNYLAQLAADLRSGKVVLALGNGYPDYALHLVEPLLADHLERSIQSETPARMPPEANELAAMARDARRWQAMQSDGLIDIRIDGQEFTGISDINAWADARTA